MPNDDVVGVTWQPYTGDRVEAFKYDASEKTWYFTENRLYKPWFDRPYVVALPGPWAVNGATAGYLTYMTGGSDIEVNQMDVSRLFYWSTDGLHYVPTGSPQDAVGAGQIEVSRPSQ